MVRTGKDGGVPWPASAGGAPNARLKSRSQGTSGATVDLAAALPELLRLLLESLHERRGLLGDAVAGGVLAHVLRDLHRAEVRPAHRAEVRELRPLRGQGLVVELARRLRVEREVELVLPAELEARLTERVVPLARAGVALGEIRGMGGDLVSDDADLAVFLVGPAEVLLGSDVAEHRGAEPADHRRTDRRGDVVVARRDVGRERPERVEGRLVAHLELALHVLFDQMHGDVAGALDHDLAVVLPRDRRQLAERLELGELRLVVGVRGRARSQAVA